MKTTHRRNANGRKTTTRSGLQPVSEAELAEAMDRLTDPTHPDYDPEFIARMEAVSGRKWNRRAWLQGCPGTTGGCPPGCVCHALESYSGPRLVPAA